MFRRLSLSQRFALTLFSVGLLLVIPLIGLQTHNARQALQQRIQSSSEVLLDALDSLARAHLTDKNIPLLRSELQQIVEQNRLAYIDVFARDGKPLIQLVHPAHPSPRGSTREAHVAEVKDNVLDLSHPLGSPENPIGRLEVGVWIAGVERDVAQVAREGYWMGLSFCLCLALISWGLGRWLAKRLRRFSENLAARAPQDYHHLDLRGSDEVSAVVEAFNHLQDRLKEAQERRDRAEQERQEMTHMLVHDLKGPLGAFAAGLGLLEDSVEKSNDPAQIQLLQLMERSTERLLRMTNGILQLDRLDDETHQLNRTLMELEPVVSRRVEEAQPLARDLGIQLIALAPSGPLPQVEGDPDMLGRVVDNLIFNALEHTPHGGRVEASVRSEAGRIQVAVRDSGPGIPVEDRNLIFEKFRKGQRQSKGVGLGLAFCKLAVERHGGTIGVEDAPGGGALFCFILPAQLPTAALQRVQLF